MSSRSKRKASQAQLTVPDSNKIIKSQHNSNIDQSCCFEGDRLAILLNGFRRIIDAERQSNKVVPDKLWYKTHFAVGVNEVTRLLERMNPSSGTSPSTTAPATPLQAVLIASDCSPKWLIKHLPSLASSRSVPLIYVKDRKEGSLRLGELVNVRTAIAIGIKGKGSNINQYVQGLLNHDELNGTGFLDSVTSS